MTWSEIVERVSKILAQLFDLQELGALIRGGLVTRNAELGGPDERQARLRQVIAGLSPADLVELVEQARRARPSSMGLMIVQSELERWVKQQNQTFRSARPTVPAADTPAPPATGGQSAEPPPTGDAKGTVPQAPAPPPPSPQADQAVTTLRLDAAVPKSVTVGLSFTIAAAVRQLSSPKLDEADLPVVKSDDAQVEWPEGQAFVRLRIRVSSAHCTINGDSESAFRLFRGQDSPTCYFELTPTVSGPINVRIELYQEEDLIGSARLNTVAEQTQRLVGQVEMVMQSVPVQAAAMTNETKQALAKALLRCSAVSDRKVRNAIVEDLPDSIRDGAERSDNALLDVRNIITRCLNYKGGLKAFIQGVRDFEGDSLPMGEVDRMLADIGWA